MIKLPRYYPNQSWKKSVPEKVDGTWRIRRHDGELVGYYDTKELAQKTIDKSQYLN